MPLSMTGFGSASCTEGDWSATVEIRTVNNRYFKLSTRLPEGFAPLETRIDARVREAVSRGTVNLSLKTRRNDDRPDYGLDEAMLRAYREQILRIDPQSAPAIGELLALPGVVVELGEDGVAKAEAAWPVIEKALRNALDALRSMRTVEGASMAADLSANAERLDTLLEKITQAAPKVVEQYRKRLTERIETLMREQGLALNPADLVREVALFADRTDISEEVVRLRSHLEQFRDVVASKAAAGRKLDFLTQEMFRETNTIGSKANDAEITAHVVEMKTVIERIREMVQNIE